MSSSLLIVGLGNPGTRYGKNRHNLGATWVQKLCQEYQIKLKLNPKLNANIASINIKNFNIICMIPNDYMNNSGLSVKLVAKFYDLPPENILIIHDELDLPVGMVKLKSNGGHGGHNGLRDIIQQLNSNNFKRLRIGIGDPGIKNIIADYVLSNASNEEQLLIDHAITTSLAILPEIASQNWEKAIQLLHNNKSLGGNNGI